MKLDKRMSALYSEIPVNKNLADIGADHGYISIKYAQNNQENQVFASDISAKSIAKAQLLAEELGLNNYKTCVADGLNEVSGEDIDVVLISGMGGQEIINILTEHLVYDFYVLSPQKNSDIVRQFLSDNSIKPIKDYKILSCNKFYDIIVAVPGSYLPSESERLFGSRSGEDFAMFKDSEVKRLTNLLNSVNEQEKLSILHKIEVLENEN